jgi:hypothetical protein
MFGRSSSLQSSHYTDYEYIIPFYTFLHLIPSNDFGDENCLRRDKKKNSFRLNVSFTNLGETEQNQAQLTARYGVILETKFTAFMDSKD